jgi:prepilin-type N-terminal cleavage/methylation domain-containing protein/prepilin-type processing-associated H-X9-DG protein
MRRQRREKHRTVPPGFTLVELLVVLAVIGLLAAILLPVLGGVVESNRRLRCQNNLRELGIALRTFHTSREHWPAGAESREYPVSPGHPHAYYRWSALARLLPYLEFSQNRDSLSLNFDVPLYMPNLQVSVENTTAVGTLIESFLCPSDRSIAVAVGFGPVNYVTCTGSGAEGGTPFKTDGMFYINSALTSRDVRDGESHTVLMSESLLGDGPEQFFNRKLATAERVYTFANVSPLTEAACRQSSLFNFTNRRGFSWANGEYRTTMYNHHRTPNSKDLDCVSNRLVGDVTVRYAAYGWRTARSNHAGGVNVLTADGAVWFIGDSIDAAIWRAVSTREGGEQERF